MLTDHRHVAYFYGVKLLAPLYTVEGGIDIYLKIFFEIDLSDLLSSIFLLLLSLKGVKAWGKLAILIFTKYAVAV
jgi:hypothetical protein